MERGNGFEPSHPRVEALVHSLFYVTPAYVVYLLFLQGIERAHSIEMKKKVKKIGEYGSYFIKHKNQVKIIHYLLFFFQYGTLV